MHLYEYKKLGRCEQCEGELYYDCINDVYYCEGRECDNLNDKRYSLKNAYIESKANFK